MRDDIMHRAMADFTSSGMGWLLRRKHHMMPVAVRNHLAAAKIEGSSANSASTRSTKIGATAFSAGGPGIAVSRPPIRPSRRRRDDANKLLGASFVLLHGR